MNKSTNFPIAGRAATVLKDADKNGGLWNTFIKTTFPDGKQDSGGPLISFTTDTGYYWDTTVNRIISFKMAACGMTGENLVDNEEDKLKFQLRQI